MKKTKQLPIRVFLGVPCLDSSAHTFFIIVTYVVTYFPFFKL